MSRSPPQTNPVNITAYPSERFSLDNEDSIKHMLAHLDERGYAVIANVASASEVEKARDLFWQYCETPRKKFDGTEVIDFKRDDCMTWDDWLGNADTGIIASPNFNHSDFCWYSRLLPKVKKAFASIWSTEELIVSFDAGNAFRPWQIHPGWVTARNWWHVDQNSLRGPERQGKVCVQGLVTYYDVTETTGGLCVIPGSHREHDALCARSSSSETLRDFVYLEATDPILTDSNSEGGGAILPLAKAGDLILWDSRVVHCNTPGVTPETPLSSFDTQSGKRIRLTEEELKASIQRYQEQQGEGEGERKLIELLRLVSYVCMLPRGMNPAYLGVKSERERLEVLDFKKKGFLSKTPTSHWATEKLVFVLDEDEKDQWRSMKDCSDEMLRLAGFSEKEIREKRYISSSSSSKCTIS